LRKDFLAATFVLTILSAVHYLYLVAQRLHALDERAARVQ
jgi:hypothetical protein